MNAINYSNIIIGGFLNPTNPHHSLKCKQKIKLENKELLPPPCLDQAYYSKEERKTREWGVKGNKLTRLGAPKLYALL